MRRLSTSTKIYLGLILTLAISNAIQVFLPAYQSFMPSEPLPAPIPVLALVNAGIAVIYGGLGFIGLRLGERLGFAGIWEPGLTNRQKIFVPAVIGACLGVFLIVSDLVFSRFNGIGRLIHPNFPSSFFASISAGIGEEIIFRLFFIPLWVWLISSVFLGGRWQNAVFWAISIISALVFAVGHFPALIILYGFKTVGEIPPALTVEIILLNGVISLFAAHYMRKYGFLAAAGIHFWTDIVWHVIWGLF